MMLAAGDARLPACFKAYDIRGRVPDELDADLMRRIGRAAARVLAARQVVVGHDCRLSSPDLRDALVAGLTAGGVDVIELGLCGTEEVYHATSALVLDGGFMITASHNPADDNGLKIVRRDSRPVSRDSGLDEIGRLAVAAEPPAAAKQGRQTSRSLREEYVRTLLRLVDAGSLKPCRIVVDAGHGGAGPAVDALAPHLPGEFLRLHWQPDGTFPAGVPNPLLPENRRVTAEAVRTYGADLGVAWDGDFDRCFLFDEQGEFVEGYYVVGLLARAVLRREPGAHIVHDPRLVWNTIEIVRSAGGVPICNKTGHAFMKERMRSEDAAYGGEMSAHHYFRDFAYCDSGMLPWLLVLQEMTITGRPLSQLVRTMQEAYPISGEINRRLADPETALAAVRARYAPQALREDRTDGLSLELDGWRFNLRLSNTEPVVRLNVESRGDRALMQSKTDEILALLDSLPPAPGAD
jgi:phosphomannomutase